MTKFDIDNQKFIDDMRNVLIGKPHHQQEFKEKLGEAIIDYQFLMTSISHKILNNIGVDLEKELTKKEEQSYINILMLMQNMRDEQLIESYIYSSTEILNNHNIKPKSLKGMLNEVRNFRNTLIHSAYYVKLLHGINIKSNYKGVKFKKTTIQDFENLSQLSKKLLELIVTLHETKQEKTATETLNLKTANQLFEEANELINKLKQSDDNEE